MKVHEAMTREVKVAAPGDTLAQAAQVMAESDIGFLPIAENDRLVGMLTDRDIVVRGLAAGKTQAAQVRDVMTAEVRYCFEDEDLDEAAQNMGQLQVRRLPVLSREKRLVGVLSLADAALNYSPQVAGSALCAIVEPGGERSQHPGDRVA